MVRQINTRIPPFTLPKAHALIDSLSEEDIADQNISLFNGLSGLALYYFFLGEYQDPSFIAKGRSIVNTIIERLNTSNFKLSNFYSLCNGLAGVAYTLNYANKKGYLESSLEEQLEVLDEIVVKMGLEDFQNKNTDFLHGPLGVFLYLCKKEKGRSVKKQMEEILLQFKVNAKRDERGFRAFNSVIYGQSASEYNLSLAHGLSGQLMILTEAYEQGFAKKEIKSIVEEGVKYLLSFNRNKSGENHVPYFPSYCVEETEKEEQRKSYTTRVAWCYGDLNEALLFLKIGKVFSNKDWWNLGIEIATQTASRRCPAQSIVKDAFVCHGASGTAYIYHKIFKKTNRSIFAETRDYWLGKVDGLMESSMLDVLPRSYLSLLEGPIGVALTTFALENNLVIDFDEILLLD